MLKNKFVILILLFFVSALHAEGTSSQASDPVVISRTRPHYPDSDRKAKHEGYTRIKFVVTAAGKTDLVEVYRTSGWPSLDKQAIKAVKRWKFIPARNYEGQAVPHDVIVNIQFGQSNRNQ